MGPISLRATCAVACVVMIYRDGKWIEAIRDNNIKRDLEDRYIDDIRVILKCQSRGDGDGSRTDYTGAESGNKKMRRKVTPRKQERAEYSRIP